MTLPAYWAGSLINGDNEGLTDAEIANMEDHMYQYTSQGWFPVSIAYDDDGEEQEPRFTRQYLIHGGRSPSGFVLDYVFHRESELTH